MSAVRTRRSRPCECRRIAARAACLEPRASLFAELLAANSRGSLARDPAPGLAELRLAARRDPEPLWLAPEPLWLALSMDDYGRKLGNGFGKRLDIARKLPFTRNRIFRFFSPGGSQNGAAGAGASNVRRPQKSETRISAIADLR